MKKNILLITIATLFITGANTKAAELTFKQQKADTLKVKSVDPVCKMKVKAGTTITHVHNKALYGFCAESCKKRFAGEPEKYVKK